MESTSQPSGTATHRGWLIAGVGLAGLIGVFFGGTLVTLERVWSNDPDYSHGYLILPFAAYLLWHRRGLAQAGSGGRWLGMLLLIASAALRLATAYYSYPLADAGALPLCLAGAALLLGGWPAFRWSWPAILFVCFMIPLPGFISERLAGPLQHLATICSTYLLQTMGVPAAAIGNIIHLSEPPPIMVVEACSGLRMLMCFMAITLGAAFIVEWGLLERLVIVMSGIPIAVISNVTRITSTGLVQEFINAEVANKVFHDFAGWLMMPFACLLVALELWLLNRAFPRSELQPLVSGGGRTIPMSRAVVATVPGRQATDSRSN